MYIQQQKREFDEGSLVKSKHVAFGLLINV